MTKENLVNEVATKVVNLDMIYRELEVKINNNEERLKRLNEKLGLHSENMNEEG